MRARLIENKMNNVKKDLTGLVVSVHAKRFLPEFQELIKAGFMCEAGFGCNPNTNGEKIFGYWALNKEQDHISGRDVKDIIG